MTIPTAENLFMIILAMLAVESAPSIRFLYNHFICKITSKSLNAFYNVCSHIRFDCSCFMNITTSLALSLITEPLCNEPVFLCIDDTMISKFGKKFENVSNLFDHAGHNGSNYLNGHCFVSLMICVPTMQNNKIVYVSIPLGYKMWTKEISKLDLAAEMVRQIMPDLKEKNQVILLFDSWYAKKNLTCLAYEFENLDIVCNARCDTAMYDLPPERTGKKGRPAKRGKRLYISDFTLSADKIGDYYIGYKKVITNIFEHGCVYAYVTTTNPKSQTRRLFFSTIRPEDIRMSCAWQEKAPLNQTGSEWMQYVPFFCYSFRWNIEISYYEQKTFWSLSNYMLRSKTRIENLVNLINIAYCSMKILPYTNEEFRDYRGKSVQEFRLALSEQINSQIFYCTFVKNIESVIKSNSIIEHLKCVLRSVGYHC